MTLVSDSSGDTLSIDSYSVPEMKSESFPAAYLTSHAHIISTPGPMTKPSMATITGNGALAENESSNVVKKACRRHSSISIVNISPMC